MKTEQVAAVSALDDKVRVELYGFVRREGRPVTREEAARAVRISVKLAAFHLDKLVDRGLLRADDAIPHGTIRGVGRAPKRYAISSLEISLSLPERRYDLMGEIFLDSFVEATEDKIDEPLLETALRVARARGQAIGTDEREARHLVRPGPERTISAAGALLEKHGYEPIEDGEGGLILRNCPFHGLTQRAPELVCSLNLQFVDGIVRGLGNNTVRTELAPQTGNCCCVRLRAPRRTSRESARALEWSQQKSSSGLPQCETRSQPGMGH